jgi:hypothetical protein
MKSAAISQTKIEIEEQKAKGTSDSFKIRKNTVELKKTFGQQLTKQ